MLVLPSLHDLDFDDKTGGLALVFDSESPNYSYLRTDQSGRVVEAAEKRVISRHASAGTYFFRSPAVLLRAIAHNLEHPRTSTFKGQFFVCPLLNGVISQGLDVRIEQVEGVHDVKLAGD